jgi:hypothetical protein
MEPAKPITKKDVDQLALALGQFIMKFELMVEMLWKGIIQMCSARGTDNWQVLEILIADLSAEQLLRKYEGMFTYTLPVLEDVKERNDWKNDKEASQLMKEIYEEAKKALEQRNKVAHAFWFIQSNFDSETQSIGNPKLVGRNERLKKNKGLQNSFYHLNSDPVTELIEWTEKIRITVNKIMKLTWFINKLPTEQNEK